MKTMKILMSALILTAFVGFTSCDKENDDALTGEMMIEMTDAPAAYDEVNVDIKMVQVHYADAADAPKSIDGWINLNTKAGMYNLLDLQHGLKAVLSPRQDIPAGKLTQVRLILGEHNNVLLGDVYYPLTVPSGAESGLKLNINETISNEELAYVLLDFDAEASVVMTSDGSYNLKPVIKVLE